MASPKNGVKVVVVGAGISGLSAAAKLIDGGVENVIILEAQERIGGRIHTIETGENSVLDLGAQWIHGEKGNCVHKFAKKHSLLAKSLKVGASGQGRSLEYEDANFFTSKGETVPREVINEMLDSLMHIYNEAEVFFSSESGEDSDSDKNSSSEEDEVESHFNAREMFPVGQTPKSFGEFFDECFQQVLKKTIDGDSFSLKKAFAAWEEQWQGADNACSSMHHIGLKGWGKYYDCPGDEHVELVGGFKSIIDIIAKDIPLESILLSKPVQTVHWPASLEVTSKISTDARNSLGKVGESEPQHTSSDNCRTFVQCEDGSEFEADYIIMTPSVGYLKEKADTLFNPCLPDAKRVALRTMEFGTMNKIFLEWETVFWKEGCTGFQFLWLEDVPVTIKSDTCRLKTQRGRPWYQNLIGFEAVVNQPKMLHTFVSGDNATILETVSDEEVIAVCLEILKTFTKMDVPKPKRIFRSSWYSNPYMRGSYSRLGRDTPLEDHERLMEPLPDCEIPVLQFAGEAYSRHHFTTTHGAMETGRLAADRILKHIKKD